MSALAGLFRDRRTLEYMKLRTAQAMIGAAERHLREGGGWKRSSKFSTQFQRKLLDLQMEIHGELERLGPRVFSAWD